MKSFSVALSLVALIAAGCGGNAAVPGLGTPANSTTSVTTDSVTVVGVRLDPEKPLRDPRYGFVLGYFKGTTSHQSQVIGLSMGSKVKFVNVDGNDPHTVSFLGKATAHTAPWPKAFNGSATKSPAGTAIGTTKFSTGPLNPGQTSAVYSTGLPGFYMVGCAFHYDSNMMRTVIIVR